MDELKNNLGAAAPQAEANKPPATAKQATAAAAYSDPKRPHAPGEKIFQRRVHFWLDYVVNSGLSIALTYTWAVKFKEKGSLLLAGKDFSFSNCVETVGKWFGKLPGLAKDEAHLHKYGETGMNLVGLSIVGWLLLFPIKWLKEKELEHVKKIDAKLDDQRGTPLTAKEQEDRAVAYEAIENRPKQSAKTVVMSRLGGLAFNWIGGTFLLKFIADQANKVESVRKTGWVRHIDHYFQDFAKWASESKVLGPALKTPGARAKFSGVFSLVMLELWGCGLTAFGLKKAMDWEEKHRGKKMAEQVPPTANAAPTPVTSEAPTPEEKKVEHAARLRLPAPTYREAALRDAASSPPALGL